VRVRVCVCARIRVYAYVCTYVCVYTVYDRIFVYLVIAKNTVYIDLIYMVLAPPNYLQYVLHWTTLACCPMVHFYSIHTFPDIRFTAAGSTGGCR